MVYFALPVAQLFLQGVDQRFLFGQALFQQEDVVRRDVVHKPVFYRAYSVTTRIKRFTAWSGRSAAAWAVASRYLPAASPAAPA
ncbi:hypothetical protein ACN58_18475 [Escherichia coli]|nr:hypothetical protein ACN58_18475 [Escherichia coli]OKV51339.1 hypothetical protein AWP62_20065 [Escherichia coli]